MMFTQRALKFLGSGRIDVIALGNGIDFSEIYAGDVIANSDTSYRETMSLPLEHSIQQYIFLMCVLLEITKIVYDYSYSCHINSGQGTPLSLFIHPLTIVIYEFWLDCLSALY